MIKLLSLLLITTLVASEKVIINQELDVMLERANLYNTEMGLGLQKLPDRCLPEVHLIKGVQLGLNSIERTGDCSLSVDKPGVIFYNFKLGFKLLSFAFGRISFHGDEMSGSFRIRNNSISLSYWLKEDKHNCNVTLGDYRFDALTDVVFESSLKKYDGTDVSRLFTKYILPRANQEMDKNRWNLQHILQNQFCQHREEEETYMKLSIPIKIVTGLNIFSKL